MSTLTSLLTHLPTLHDLGAQLRALLAQNQLAQGGLLLGALGTLAATLRRWPQQLWQAAVQHAVFTLEIDGQDPAFVWLSVWLSQHPSSRRLRHMGVATRFNEQLGGLNLTLGTDCDGDDVTVRLIPLSGASWLRYRGHWLLIRPSRQKEEGGGRQLGYTHTLTLRMLGVSRSLTRQLLQDAYDATAGARGSLMEIYAPDYQGWQVVERRPARAPQTLIYGDELMETLLEDVRRFQADRTWYAEMGIPYRRGYLLHGPPGNGKSSLAGAVAGAAGLNICVLNLATPELSDDRLSSLLAALPRRALLLLEDIDAVFDGRERRSETVKLSFAGLLNALDGVAAGEGRLTFLTTNHPEQLDPALVRPGRADLHLQVGNATRLQALGMLERFYPQASFPQLGAEQRAALGSRWPERQISMARLQEFLLARRGDPLRAGRDWAGLCGEKASEKEAGEKEASAPLSSDELFCALFRPDRQPTL